VPDSIQKYDLKIHKNANFFGFDFEFCTVTFFDWTTLGGGRIIPRSLKTTGSKNYFKCRPNFFYLFKSYMIPLYLLKIVFPKFDPLTVTGDGYMC
jgi:hypothetical protein